MKIERLCGSDATYFFGYYGMNPWDGDGQSHLCLKTSFDGRRPGYGDSALVGLINRETKAFAEVGRTLAFNFQQGSMLNFIYPTGREEIAYNAFIDGRLLSVAADINGGKRLLGGAIAAVSRDKKQAMSLNYIRNFQLRSVVGYDVLPAYPEKLEPHPCDDGLFYMDLLTGETRLVLSIKALIDRLPCPNVFEGCAWFDHIQFSPSDRRLLFMCRIKRGSGWYSSLWTVNPDGTNLQNRIGYDFWISHFDWLDDEQILISTDALGKPGFCMVNDTTGEIAPYHSDILPRDGHACFSPDRKWLLSDTSPFSEGYRNLFLFNTETFDRISLGDFAFAPEFTGDIRCDLHPRWNAAGDYVTFDSIHEGTRGIYGVDVSGLVR